MIAELLAAAALVVAAGSAISAKRSAGSSESSAKEAKRAADAAERHATATEQQVVAGRVQLETQINPRISIVSGTVQGVSKPDIITFQNVGNGIAQALELNYSDQSAGSKILLPQRNIGVGDSVSVRVEGSRAAKAGLKLKYEISLGFIYELKFLWNGQASQAVGDELTRSFALPTSKGANIVPEIGACRIASAICVVSR